MFDELRKPGGKLKLAVPRGALLDDVLGLLDQVGIDTAEARGDSRSLVFDGGETTLVTMRPSDVPTYVSAGAADLGITGKDVLLEQNDRPVFELVDLGVGRCRMVLATQKGDVAPSEHQRRLGMMKIATKYKRIAEQYFAEQGRQVELVEVKGSIELAPLVGLADGIVDLVATGRTLAENNLEVREEILTSSARLVANRVSYRIRSEEVDDLAARLREAARKAPGES
ncbi:MAG: phosphoribosyltransferase [Actinomycetota bacterium]|jgi:ATP phosphoribosyltransferase|nr:phosphoribosyltransferase [Actinomycetota bacterium]